MKSENHWEGTEKLVERTDETHIEAEYRFKVPQNLIKAAYYLNNILEILLPGQIPHMQKAWANKYVADFVPHDQRHEEIQHSVEAGLESLKEAEAENDERVKELNNKLLALGIYSDNKSGRNYIINPEGKAEYVDTVLPWQVIKVYDKSAVNQTKYRLELNVNLEKLSEQLQNISDETLNSKALGYLNRLNELWVQESKKTNLSEYLH